MPTHRSDVGDKEDTASKSHMQALTYGENM